MCYTSILVKKEKKILIIATQVLEIEAGSEENPSNCYIVPHCVCQHLPSTSPCAPPSCWRTASASAQPLTRHTAQGLGEEMLWPQHIFPHRLSNLGPVQTSLECTTFCRAFPPSFPHHCKRKQQHRHSLVIRSHLSLLQPLGFHWILDQWGFGPGSHNANE